MKNDKETKTSEDQISKSEDQISNDRRLNQNTLQKGYGGLPVTDGETKEYIPGLMKTRFRLTVPYRIVPPDEGIALAAPDNSFGLNAGRFPKYHFKTLTDDVAKDLTAKFIRQKEKGLVGLCIAEVNLRLFPEAQPALEGYPLNAFQTKGTLYRKMP